MEAIEIAEYGGVDAMELTERDVPDPGEGEVRIEVRAAGVNFADIMQRRGHYQGGPEPPYVPGMEVAGVIDAVGEGVNREPGEAVVSLVEKSGYAEYALADARGLLEVPGDTSFEEAAGFPVQWLTAHNCLHEWGDLEAEETAAEDRLFFPPMPSSSNLSTIGGMIVNDAAVLGDFDCFHRPAPRCGLRGYQC